MSETFRCPACSAPLEFEGKPIQKCKFCGGNVIVPSGVIRGSSTFGSSGSLDFGDLSALTGRALKIAEIQRFLQQGQKIQAIKVFRETFGTGLAEAKDAVEAMERGESIDISGMTIQSSPRKIQTVHVDGDAVKKAAIGIGGSVIAMVVGIMLLVGGIVAFVFFKVSQTVNKVVERSVPVLSTPKPQSSETSSIAKEFLRFGGEGVGAGKFKDNRTVAVAADGRIFSAELSGGRVQVFDSEGKFQTQITADTNRSVDAIEVDRKGTLYVLQGYDLKRFDSSTGDELGTTRVEYATDLALGLDGKAYVSTRRSEIAVLAASGEKQRLVKLAKDLNIDDIKNLAIDGTGNFYVIDSRKYAIFKLSPDGTLLNRFAGRSEDMRDRTPKGMFASYPTDIAVDSAGRVYASETDRVLIFDSNGNYLKEFATKQTFGIAIDDKDRVFVASRPFVVGYSISD